MILANRRITVREVAEDLNISIGSCHSIFINDLGMRRVAAKFVPKLLNCDQKQHRMNIANEMLDSVRDDPNLLQRVITGDEAWVYGYDVETKAQSSQWKLPHEPRPKKARQVRSNVKVLLTVFFDCRGVVHHEFLPQGRTVNKEYYLQVMRNLREAIRQKRPDLWKNKNWLLHHDNAPAHTSLLVRDFLAKNNTLMMPQPLYSSDLAPCDFFLFPKLKRPMKGRRYATLDKIKTASKEELKKILKNDFLKCFEDWKNRWHKCIISHGDYFEGDKIECWRSNQSELCAGIKPYKCEQCSASFTRQHSLKYHTMIHEERSRFTCPTCCKEFRHPSHYKEHLRRHTGETPFHCTDCQRKWIPSRPDLVKCWSHFPNFLHALSTCSSSLVLVPFIWGLKPTLYLLVPLPSYLYLFP
ncbi:hypothetical protein LAZ67_2003639 [Cordylochernes scorpioides]|uniref:C2H2-type domain-containing protein n=1 Tax=Cordylochernes scorpioides TaxID=51811 RepID=A0ABY6K461_9ARAC|nr:hypothetical protein LAZ67_2003639 [Cordylochernes scorpioides]